ncbi:hypothetical protein E2C01_050477 [Portunus trituberculatus]|uniref:Uncharacterized protein n=1 Tax=Portunus trituberculatus TaxID=210409 RepID=A0A5B7GGH8_PORTR|nr:hypothetical protein [Portunus trituberculatus]
MEVRSLLSHALEHIQQTAAQNAWHYLPVAVSPTSQSSPCGRALSAIVKDLQHNFTWPAFIEL